MPDAFILFKTEPTHERDVYLRLIEDEHVIEVHALYGEFDLLSHVSAATSASLTTLLISKFRQIPGVKETRTLIAV